jgi:hypothetical protein
VGRLIDELGFQDWQQFVCATPPYAQTESEREVGRLIDEFAHSDGINYM